MILYDYWRSSAAYRVRIALNMKSVEYSGHSVHLVNQGGEHRKPDYLAVNPQGLVPALKLESGQVLTQSIAIIEYLDETIPEPALIPGDAAARAQIRAFAEIIACDIHPVNNLRILQYLKRKMGQEQEAIDLWYRHWVEEGFRALETQVRGIGKRFMCADSPTLADICLVPQMYNARRLSVNLHAFPCLVEIDARAREVEAFRAAAPETHKDSQ